MDGPSRSRSNSSTCRQARGRRLRHAARTRRLSTASINPSRVPVCLRHSWTDQAHMTRGQVLLCHGHGRHEGVLRASPRDCAQPARGVHDCAGRFSPARCRALTLARSPEPRAGSIMPSPGNSRSGSAYPANPSPEALVDEVRELPDARIHAHACVLRDSRQERHTRFTEPDLEKIVCASRHTRKPRAASDATTHANT